jgi:hypothetical protein
MDRGAAVPIFQCFFYSDCAISYWENIDCAECSLPKTLGSMLEENGWKLAEAWLEDKLVSHIEKGARIAPDLN